MEVIRTTPIAVKDLTFLSGQGAWGDIDFALQGAGVTLSASSTAAGYSINNVVNPANRVGDIQVPSTCWKANVTGISTVTVTFSPPRKIVTVELVFPQDSANSTKLVEYTKDSKFTTEGVITGDVTFAFTSGGSSFVNIVANTFGIVQCSYPFETLVDSVTINLNTMFANKPASLTRISCYGVATDYNSGTTYSKGALVSFDNGEYESLQAGNLNKTPNLSTSALFWLFRRPSNRAALVDSKISTPRRAMISSGGSGIIQDIRLEGDLLFINRLVALNVKGNSFSACLKLFTDVYNKSTGAYFTRDFTTPFSTGTLTLAKQPENFVVNLPPLTGAGTTEDATFRYVSYYVLEFYVNFGGTYPRNTPVEIGELLVGTAEDLGLTSYGLSAGIISYSEKTTDVYGNTSIVKRANAKKMQVKMQVPKADHDRVFNALQALDAVPCVWVGSSDSAYSASTVIYGFYKSFDVSISYPTYSICDLQIEGLT